MREWMALFEQEICSPEMMAWAKRWGKDSTEMEDQVFDFETVKREAIQWCRDHYSCLYRGFGITDEQSDKLASGEEIEVTVHPLQSWTQSFHTARDYGQAGVEKGVGIVIRRHDLDAVFDFKEFCHDWIMNNEDQYIRDGNIIAGDSYGITDAFRESEVIVRVSSPFIIRPDDVVEMY